MRLTNEKIEKLGKLTSLLYQLVHFIEEYIESDSIGNKLLLHSFDIKWKFLDSNPWSDLMLVKIVFVRTLLVGTTYEIINIESDVNEDRWKVKCSSIELDGYVNRFAKVCSIKTEKYNTSKKYTMELIW